MSEQPQDPWERYGWLMAAIWLVFLGFPITAAVTADTSWAWRVVGVSIIVAFAVVYLHAAIRPPLDATVAQRKTFGLRHLVALLTLIAVATPVIGWNAVGMAPFVVSFSMFALPLTWAGVVYASTLIGVLGGSLLGGVFQDLWFLGVIVALVGAATGLVRIIDDRQADHKEVGTQLAVTAERERVARDVHDVLGHSLTVISLKAELAERLLDAGDDTDGARAEVRAIHDLSRQALAEVRSTVGGLRIARLADEVVAARAVLADASIEASLPDDLTVVDPRHRIVLAWSLREAVTNVVRHSRAEHCTVEVGPRTLVVTDDGRGMNGHREGNGIRGLRERVDAAGGTLSLEQGPDGNGSRLAVHL